MVIRTVKVQWIIYCGSRVSLSVCSTVGFLDCDEFWCEVFLAGLYADQDHDLLWSLEQAEEFLCEDDLQCGCHGESDVNRHLSVGIG